MIRDKRMGWHLLECDLAMTMERMSRSPSFSAELARNAKRLRLELTPLGGAAGASEEEKRTKFHKAVRVEIADAACETIEAAKQYATGKALTFEARAGLAECLVEWAACPAMKAEESRNSAAIRRDVYRQEYMRAHASGDNVLNGVYLYQQSMLASAQMGTLVKFKPVKALSQFCAALSRELGGRRAPRRLVDFVNTSLPALIYAIRKIPGKGSEAEAVCKAIGRAQRLIDGANQTPPPYAGESVNEKPEFDTGSGWADPPDARGPNKDGGWGLDFGDFDKK